MLPGRRMDTWIPHGYLVTEVCGYCIPLIQVSTISEPYADTWSLSTDLGGGGGVHVFFVFKMGVPLKTELAFLRTKLRRARSAIGPRTHRPQKGN